MHATTPFVRLVRLFPLVLFGGTVAVQACQTVTVDPTGGGVPPAGVIRGSVVYSGPPPCSQGGHIVGNAVVLVFDARNPPPPNGLGNTAVNFGVVSGDVLFHDYPVTPGDTKICPAANAAPISASAEYVVAPMSAGQYLISAFFDYTGDFFATFKFRNLPEAMDVGGGYIDLNEAQELVQPPSSAGGQPLKDGGTVYPVIERQADPNFIPISLPVNVGIPSGTPPTSLRGVPDFTMPPEGYVADNVTVTMGLTLPLARPYFYPEGAALPGAVPTTPTPGGITYGGNSGARPTPTVNNVQNPALKTAQNPSGDVDFVPVLSFPQDILIYAQPSTTAAGVSPIAFDQYQEGFPQLVLHAGVPVTEQPVAADISKVTDPFHMQLGIPNAPPNYAPGGNGGLFVWWDGTHLQQDCNGLANCAPSSLDSIPENAALRKMWPLVVLAKLSDLPTGANQPNPNDLQAVNPQGSDLTKPIVIIQGITLGGDSLLQYAQGFSCLGADCSSGSANNSISPILAYPDKTNLQDHVTVMVRPSTLCVDPRAPDHGGVLVTPGTIVQNPGTSTQDPVILGSYPPGDTFDNDPTTAPGPPVVVDSEILSNPQLAALVNHKENTSNGLVGACLPTGRYEVNMVYPTGQAWTTPNESGSCASLEGSTVFTGSGPTIAPGTCTGQARPVLYSQGTRAIVEITPTTNPKNCKSANPTDGSIAAVPFACTQLCSDPSLDPMASPPCSKPLP